MSLPKDPLPPPAPAQAVTLDLDTPAERAQYLLFPLGFAVPGLTLAALAVNPHLVSSRAVSHALVLASLAAGAAIVFVAVRLMQTVDCLYVLDRRRGALVYERSWFGYHQRLLVAATADIRAVHVRGKYRPPPAFPAPICAQMWLSVELADGRRIRVSNRVLAPRNPRHPADSVEKQSGLLLAKANRVAELLGLETKPAVLLEHKELEYRMLYVVQMAVGFAGMFAMMAIGDLPFDAASYWAPIYLAVGFAALAFCLVTLAL